MANMSYNNSGFIIIPNNVELPSILLTLKDRITTIEKDVKLLLIITFILAYLVGSILVIITVNLLVKFISYVIRKNNQNSSEESGNNNSKSSYMNNIQLRNHVFETNTTRSTVEPPKATECDLSAFA